MHVGDVKNELTNWPVRWEGMDDKEERRGSGVR